MLEVKKVILQKNQAIKQLVIGEKILAFDNGCLVKGSVTKVDTLKGTVTLDFGNCCSKDFMIDSIVEGLPDVRGY